MSLCPVRSARLNCPARTVLYIRPVRPKRPGGTGDPSAPPREAVANLQHKGERIMSKSRDQMVAAIKAQLDETNEMLDDLEKKASKASADAQAKYEEQIAKLQQQSEEVQTKLTEMAKAGEESWRELLAEAEKMRDAFIHSINYFRSQL